MRNLVTGATGLVGNNLVRLLLERGESVRVLARRPNDRSLEGLPVEIVTGDITDPQIVHQAIQGVERVFHAAGHVHIGWTGAELHQQVNVEGTRHVAAAVQQAGIRMVHVSSVNTLPQGTIASPADEETPVTGLFPCPYVLSKRAAEQFLTAEVASGLDAVIVKPVYMLGPWDWKPSSGRMILEVSSGLALMAPPGGNDFADVRDVASGIIAAAEMGKPGRQYILGGEPLSYMQAWQMIATMTGVRPPIRKMRAPANFIVSRFADLKTWLTGRETNVNSAAGPSLFLFACRRRIELSTAAGVGSDASRLAVVWRLRLPLIQRQIGTL